MSQLRAAADHLADRISYGIVRGRRARPGDLA